MLNTRFSDKCLSESLFDTTLLIGDWLKQGLSSQRIITTDDQSKNTMSTALPAK